MNKLRVCAWLGLFSTLVVIPSVTQAADQRLAQAEQCSLVSGRLERLDCFDRVFRTPLPEKELTGQVYPESWQRAMDAAHQDGNKLRTLVTQGTGKGSSAWLAFTAMNTHTQFQGNAKPILLMSCMNNLSRVELVLPDPVQDGRIRIAVAGGQQQYWRSDDLGVLMSSARGLPAIDMMKAMTAGNRLVLRSNSNFADGLEFDTRGVADELSALRQRCGW